MPEEEKQQIIQTEEFKHFIDRSARIIERALFEQVDIFADYTGEDRDENEGWVNEGISSCSSCSSSSSSSSRVE